MKKNKGPALFGATGVTGVHLMPLEELAMMDLECTVIRPPALNHLDPAAVRGWAEVAR